MAGIRGAVLAGTIVAALALPSLSVANVIKVTGTADELDAVPDATCSLREAFQSARLNAAVGGCPAGNTDSNLDGIKLGAHDYELTIPTTNEDGNANGDLDLTGGGSVTVVGKGRSATTVGTALLDRVIDFTGGNPDTLWLRRLTISGGDVTGFGTGNGRGGGVAADAGGTVVLDKVRVTDGDAYVGGGLYVVGPAAVVIDRSQFDGNDATGLAGALDVIGGVTTIITRSSFDGNTVSDPSDAAEAGAISNRGTLMKIDDTAITDNHAIGMPGEAAYAGAISSAAGAKLTLRRSLIAGNSAATPTNNIFEGAGGIFSASATAPVKITNSTFYDNDAGSPDGKGGAIYVNDGTMTVANVTFLLNGAPDGGDSVYAGGGELILRNSILPGLMGFLDPCDGGAITSGGFNLAAQDDPECQFGGTDLVAAGSLGFAGGGIPADHGGATDTIALKKSSPAVDLIPKAACKPAKHEDQRGFHRPAGKLCDAGAYERGATP